MNSSLKVIFSSGFVLVMLVLSIPAAAPAFAQVGSGDLVNIGPPFDATAMDSFTDESGTTYVAYHSLDENDEAEGPGIYLGIVDIVDGVEVLREPPTLVSTEGTDPSIYVSNPIFIVGSNAGGVPSFNQCVSEEESSTECTEDIPVNEEQEEDVIFTETFGTGMETFEVCGDGCQTFDDRFTVDDCDDGCDNPAHVLLSPNGAWSVISDTQWIGETAGAATSADDFDTTSYFATFTLPSEHPDTESPLVVDSALLNIEMHADNVGRIYLNGELIGEQVDPGTDEGGAGIGNFQHPPELFGTDDSALFLAGENVLIFEVENYSGPAGLDALVTVEVTLVPEIIITSTGSSFVPAGTQPSLVSASTCDPSSPSTDPQTVSAPDGSGGFNVYSVWVQCDDIMFVARYDVTEDSPGTPGTTLNLSSNDGISANPRIALTNPIHVTWEDDTSGNFEIMYTRSTDDGVSFSDPRNISNTPKKSIDHELSTAGSSVHVVFEDYTTGNGDIYYRRSLDNGATFNTPSGSKNLSKSAFSFLASRDPDIATLDSGKVSVVWAAYPVKDASKLGEIIYRESDNGGSSFEKLRLVSKTIKDSKEPSVGANSERIVVAWLDKGGPSRTTMPANVYGVLASESTNGATFSAAVNLSDTPANTKALVDQANVDVDQEGLGVTWDPSRRR